MLNSLFALLLAATALAQSPAPAQPPPSPQTQALQQALQNYPPLIVGSNTQPTQGGPDQVPRSCPAAGAKVVNKGGPTFEYQGASPADPDLCLIKVGDQTVEAWYGIWLTSWPGADYARRGLQRIMQSKTGDVVGFDVVMAPGYAYHDLIRQEGVETINILGTVYRALKISHYREGFDGNTYRSVATVWKDLASGMLIYGTYQHIAGRPEIDDPLIPTAIIPAP
jgi:hypothetical protein